MKSGVQLEMKRWNDMLLNYEWIISRSPVNGRKYAKRSNVKNTEQSTANGEERDAEVSRKEMRYHIYRSMKTC